ncbi:MAG: DUF86 domain-containing protein [Burkholderiaceae bacterium]|nr:DUF86 domain-containing protein [Burkholderiaceae bacterium]
MTRAPIADALAQKAARLERCIARAREELRAASDFGADFTRQDAAILNVLRACELTIDMANMVVAHEGWGLPESAREAFDLLQAHGTIDATLGQALRRMVGFRNVAVHEYEALDMTIVAAVIDRELDALPRLAGRLLQPYLP